MFINKLKSVNLFLGVSYDAIMHFKHCSYKCVFLIVIYEGWNFNSGNYLFTTDTK